MDRVVRKKKIKSQKKAGNIKCFLCDSEQFRLRHRGVRDNDDINVMECKKCGLVRLDSFDHINENMYKKSGMRNYQPPDIPTLLKRTSDDDYRRFEFCRPFIINKSVLDFGCGSGRFVLLANEVASKAIGYEIDSGWLPFYKEKKIPVFQRIDDIKGKYDVITMFHVLEHLADPEKIFKKLKTKLETNGQIIIEVPNASDALYGLFDCKDFQKFSYWKCHLYLYNSFTLYLLGIKLGLKINYIKCVQRFTLANHLHWLSKGKPDGHKQWSFIDSTNLNKAYADQLASVGMTDTLIASYSVKETGRLK